MRILSTDMAATFWGRTLASEMLTSACSHANNAKTDMSIFRNDIEKIISFGWLKRHLFWIFLVGVLDKLMYRCVNGPRWKGIRQVFSFHSEGNISVCTTWQRTTNVGQLFTTVIRGDHLGTTTVCTKFCDSPSNRWWHISLDRWKVTRWYYSKSQGVIKIFDSSSVHHGYHDSTISWRNYETIYLTFTEIFKQEWWTGRH